jgi:hypothetical protein
MTALENVELPMILKDSLSPSARRKRAMGKISTHITWSCYKIQSEEVQLH